MGLITQLRQSLLDAQHYEAARDAAAKKPEKGADKDQADKDKGDKPAAERRC